MKLKYIGLLSIGLILAILYFYINPSSSFLPKCPLYTTTGIYCPGCGSQRAFHDLLYFDFKGLLNQNILFLLGVLLLIYYLVVTISNRFFNKNIKNVLQHKKTRIVIFVLVIIFWILRNIPTYPFKLLAPD